MHRRLSYELVRFINSLGFSSYLLKALHSLVVDIIYMVVDMNINIHDDECIFLVDVYEMYFCLRDKK